MPDPSRTQCAASPCNSPPTLQQPYKESACSRRAPLKKDLRHTATQPVGQPHTDKSLICRCTGCARQPPSRSSPVKKTELCVTQCRFCCNGFLHWLTAHRRMEYLPAPTAAAAMCSITCLCRHLIPVDPGTLLLAAVNLSRQAGTPTSWDTRECVPW